MSNIYKPKKHFLQKKSFLRKIGSGGWNKKKENFSITLIMAIKKDPTMSIRKHTNELNFHNKTVRTTIKQDLSPNLNPLVYAIWRILENKTNATSIQILVCIRWLLRRNGIKYLKNLFWRHTNCFDTICEKKMVVIMSKFTVLSLSSYFVVYLFKSKLILFYNRINYYYTRIFLIILLPHPVIWKLIL